MTSELVPSPNNALLEARRAGEAHLRGQWLHVARAIWLLLSASVIAPFLPGIPASYAQQRAVCTADATQCSFNFLPTPANVRALQHLGLSLRAYAAVSTLFAVGVSLIFLAVGALIFWRRSDTWLGLLTSWVLVTLGVFTAQFPDVLLTSGPLHQPYELYTYLLAFAVILSLALFLLTFPTGRFEPGWSWVVILMMVGLFASFNLPAPYNTSYWPGALFAVGLLLAYGSPLVVQIYRYRCVYTPPQRQQTKWLVFGVSVGLLIEALSITVGSVVPGLNAPDSPYQLFNRAFTEVFFLSIPSSVGIAILRYRLWDIDAIINKTLVYGSLSAILAAVYFGAIVGVQQVVGSVNGPPPTNPLVLVLSTLLIAALFNPLRRRIQRVIDRRFFRAKYDAAQTLARFAATLRQDVDLAELREHLVGVVDEAMRPAHVSLWLSRRDVER